MGGVAVILYRSKCHPKPRRPTLRMPRPPAPTPLQRAARLEPVEPRWLRQARAELREAAIRFYIAAAVFRAMRQTLEATP